MAVDEPEGEGTHDRTCPPGSQHTCDSVLVEGTDTRERKGPGTIRTEEKKISSTSTKTFSSRMRLVGIESHSHSPRSMNPSHHTLVLRPKDE